MRHAYLAAKHDKAPNQAQAQQALARAALRPPDFGQGKSGNLGRLTYREPIEQTVGTNPLHGKAQLWHFEVGQDEANRADNLIVAPRPYQDMAGAPIVLVGFDIRAWLGGFELTFETIYLMSQAIGFLQGISITSDFDGELLAYNAESG